MTPPEPTLPEVQAAIDKLRREDRAMLRPWILAHYDARGYAARGYVDPPTRIAATPIVQDGPEASAE